MDRLGDRRRAPAQGRWTAGAAGSAETRVDAREDGLHAALKLEDGCDMEVVLLWLDDLDDALFTVALAWERLRRAVLQVGLTSAFALAGSQLAAIATEWAPAFSYVAAASVGAWFLGTTLRVVYGRQSSHLMPAA
jgi:hypothetical protein